MPHPFSFISTNRVILDAAQNTTPSVRCAQFIDLADSQVGDEPKWVQVAFEGDFNGYFDGEKFSSFSFTREIFADIIRNLRRHPSYRAGANGVGDKPVVSWDFEHASESSATQGTIPATGAPAQGWTYDLEIRNGPKGAELWALTEFLEPAKTYVKEGKYKWASVSVWFDAVDQVSGENLGAIMSSIALTNSPFLEGMEALAATRQGKHRVEASRGWYESAKDPASAVDMIKERLGLTETATVGDINREIAKLQSWMTTGTAPLGVNVDAIAGDLRTILNLPALTPISEVLQNTSQAMVGLLDEPSLGISNNSATAQAQNIAPEDSNGSSGGETMEEFLKKLAKLLGVNATEGEVTEAITDSVELRKRAAKAVKASKPRTDEIVTAAEEATAGNDGFVALLKALGAKGFSDAIEAVTVLLDKAKTLAELEPKLEKYEKQVKEIEANQVEVDVNAALTRFPEDQRDNLRPALTLQRTSEPKVFAEKFPPVTNDQADLATNVAVAPTGQQLSLTNQNGTGTSADLQTQGAIDLGNFEGRNSTERAKSYIRSNPQTFGEYTDKDLLWKKACQLKNNEVPGQPRFFDSRSGGGR